MKINLKIDISPSATSWVGQQIVQALVQKGHSVSVTALDFDEARLTPFVYESMRNEPFARGLKVVCRPITRLNAELVTDAVVVTIWETDSISKEAARLLNLARLIIVPTPWLTNVFRHGGVITRIKVAHLGVSDEFRISMTTFPKGRVFLTAGETCHGERKGIAKVINAFLLAFPTERDVVLQVKSQERSPLPEIVSSRIQVIRGWFNTARMVEWYQQGLVFVSGAAAEGWGLHQNEAMACGKAVIGSNFGAMAILMNNANSILIPQRVSNSTMGAGRWSNWSVEDMAKAMRAVYDNPVDAFVRGLLAARSVEQFSLDEMRKQHVEAICE